MFRFILITGCVIVLSVCGVFGQSPAATPPVPVPQSDVTDELHLYFDALAKWDRMQIPVCWENAEPGFKAEMTLVQEAIAGSWQKESSLIFSGWQQCSRDNAGIRILIEDSGPHTKGLGNRLDRKPNGMVLNFTFDNWSPACKQTPEMRTSCIKSIAVHEFGHALGFAHEHNRADRPGECRAEPQGSNGTVLLTPYDPLSVMNYCNPVYNNNGVLSSKDKAGLQKIYGLPKEPAMPVNQLKKEIK